MPATPIRFGVLGAARIAPAALVRPAGDNPEVTVEAVAARDAGRAEDFARRHRVPRVLETSEVDAVYVPLPNSLHAEWTLAALEAGKHVLCEKPFTSNAEQARAVGAASSSRPGLVVMEAFHYRYHPLAHRMLEIVDSGDLGRLRHIEAWLCAPVFDKSDIRYRYDLAGGAMMDMGSYVVHMARMLGDGEPEVLEAEAKLHSPGVDRAMRARLRFGAGHTATVHCSMWSSSVLHLAARVTGDEGELRVFNPIAPHYASWLTVRDRGGRRIEIPSRRPTYSFQLDAFCDAVRRQRPVMTGPEDAVANMEVIDAVYRAANMAPRAT